MGNPFMNIMNIMKHFRGYWALPEKKHVFFFFYCAQSAFSCSFSFIMFINSTMRIMGGKFFTKPTHTYTYFMNIMNVYEEGVFMQNFCKSSFVMVVFMNLLFRRSS